MIKTGKMGQRLLSFVLAAMMIVGIVPVQAFAAAETELYLPEIILEDSILQNDVFYLASTTAELAEEGHHVYLLRVGRGGNAESESTALIKIADVTAKYGEDYIVRVHDGSAEVDNPDGSFSLLDLMEGSEYVQSDIKDDEEAEGLLENDPEARAAYEEGLETALEFLEEASGLRDKYDGENLYSEAEELYGEPDPDVVPGDGSETLVISEGSGDGLDPVQQAANLFTGVDAASQRLTTNGDMFQDLQSVADVLTFAVVGASVELTFAPGEREKYLELVPKDNRKGDGNRMFYLVLGAPGGTTTNSAASSCAVTIVDDEEQEPSVMSFSSDTYVHTPGEDTVTVTVERTGAINSVASVRIRTTGEGTARMGRDYSEVDRILFFPMGIPSVTVDIPVCTDYLTGDGTFGLSLEADSACTVGLDSAVVCLEGTYTDKQSLLMFSAGPTLLSANAADSEESAGAAAVSNTLYTIRTENGLSVKDPVSSGHENNKYGGHNYYDREKKCWRMDWEDNSILYNRKGVVGAFWEIAPKNTYIYSGVQVVWSRTNNHAVVKVSLHGSAPSSVDWHAIRSNDPEGCVYSSTDHFDYQTRNFFPDKSAVLEKDSYNPVQIGFYNVGRCDDCNWLNIYEILPILRQFQINLEKATPLDYLQEDGTQSSWADDPATKASITGSAGSPVLFPGDYFTVATPMDSSKNQYAYLDSLVWDEEGTELCFASGGDAAFKSLSVQLSEELINSMGNDYHSAFTRTLQYNPNIKDAYGYPTYSRINVKPVFGYVDSTVTLRNPYDFPVTFTISNTSYSVAAHSSTTVTYHKGDKLALTSISIDDTAADQTYKMLGARFEYKITGAETDYDTTNPEFKNGKAIYISGSGTGDDRLCYKEVIVEPNIQEKDNQIVVRVRTADLDKFDTAGVLGQTGTVSGEYTLFTFAAPDQTVNGKLYAVTATPADEKTVCCWYDANTGRYYTGNTLYYTANSIPDRNIITLTAEKAAKQLTLTGTLYYMNYNITDISAGGASNMPASGAVLTAGSAGAVADENGTVTVGPIASTGLNNRYLRYMVSVNGSSIVKEALMPTETATMDISTNFSGGVSPVTSGIFKNITITASTNDETYPVAENGAIPVLYDGLEAQIEVSIKPSNYVVSMTGKNGVKEEVRREKPISVQLVVYDPIGEIRGEYNVVEKSSQFGGVYTYTCPVYFEKAGDDEVTDQEKESGAGGFIVRPGDLLYLRLVTDRLAGAESLSADIQDVVDLLPDEDLGNVDMVVEDYQYSDIFTGLTFYSPLETTPPHEYGMESPVDIDFPDLPLIGDIGMKFDFPFLTVGIMRIDHGDLMGYRMYMGVSVMQIYDTIKDSHIATFAGDDGQYWKDLFSLAHPFSTFWGGLTSAAGQVADIHNGAKAAKQAKEAYSVASLGSPQWTFDVYIGAYYDFYYYTLDVGGSSVTDYKFAGAGLYLNVSVGFKVAWYVVIPVVFVPAYFGIEIQASVMGFLGAKVNYDVDLSYEQARKGNVNFSNAITGFNGGVRGMGYVQLCLGVGLCGTIGIRIAGRVNMIANYEPSDLHGDFGFYIGFSAGLIIDLFLFSVPLLYEFAGIPFGSFEYYAKTGSSSEHPDQSLLNAKASDPDPFTLRTGSGEDSEWVGSRPMLRYGFTPTATRTLEENAYERPDSQLITMDDGTVVLAFLSSDNAKGAYQRTTLKMATFDGTSWSQPVIVSNDSTADFQPSIAETADGRVLAAWTSTSSDAIDETTSTVDYLNSMEVYAAFITLENGRIKTRTENGVTVADTTVTQITNDRHQTDDGIAHYYDSMPTVVCDKVSGDAVIYYVKSGSATGDVTTLANPYFNDCRVFYMIYNAEEDVDSDGRTVPAGWLFNNFYYGELHGNTVSEQYMIKNFGGQRSVAGPTYYRNVDGKKKEIAYAIPDFTAIGYNGLAVFAYTVDKDGINDTDADKELFLQVYNFEQHELKYRIQLTDDDQADALPQFFRSKVFGEGLSTDDESTHTKLFWYRNGTNAVYIDVTKLIQEGINNDGTLKTSGDDEREYVYTDDSGVTHYSYVDPIVVNTMTADSNASGQSADFRVTEDANGSLFVVWTEGAADEDGNIAQELFAVSLISSADNRSDDEANGENAGNGNSGWSKPYQLTKDGYCNDEIAVAMSGENLMVVHNQFTERLIVPEIADDETIEGVADYDPIEISDMRLVATTMEPCGAVETEDIRISEDLPMGGEDVEISVTVSNNGLTTAEGYRLSLYAVDRNGSETQIGSTVETTDALAPNAGRIHEFAYTLPADTDGLYFKAVTQELKGGNVYFGNTGEYVSDPLKTKAAYAFSNLYTYQDADGFHAAFTVTNTGNAVSTPEDTVTVSVNGPADLSFLYPGEDGILYSESLTDALAPGESRDYDVSVGILPEMMADYGFVIASFAVTRQEAAQVLAGRTYYDTVYLGDIAYSDFTLVRPMDMTLEDVAVEVGETKAVSCDMKLRDRFRGGSDVIFAVDDLTVARVEDGKVVGVGAGITTLTATHVATGAVITSTVAVTGSVTPDVPDEPHGPQEPDTPDKPFDPSIPGDPEIPFLPFIPFIPFSPINVPAAGDKNAADSTDRNNVLSPAENTDRTDAPAPDEIKDADCPLNAFGDLDRSAWYHDGVHWALDEGVMNGVGNGRFDPDAATSRAMVVTMLHRMEGEPIVNYAMNFTDTADDMWYTEAIRWAAANNIVNGYGDGRFGPDDELTREQLAAILYRYAKTKGMGFTGLWSFPLDFDDASDVSDWAYEAMCWMTMNGVIQGTGANRLSPGNSATRAQVATMLMRFNSIK